jgi:hypothetical protein
MLVLALPTLVTEAVVNAAVEGVVAPIAITFSKLAEICC